MDKSSALILLVITGLLLLFADFCHALGSRQKNSQLISKSSFGIFNDYVYNPDSPDKFDMQLAGELGNGSARLIMPWEKIEAAKGVFDFTLADQLLEAHTKNNITPVVTVLSRSRWATQKSSPEASALPVRWEDYENFISTVVSRYKGKVKYWQIENEIGDNPDIPSKFWAGSKEDYLELLKHAYKAIKRADPYARVVLQGFSNEMFKRIYEGNKEAENFFLFFMSECRDYFDVIDFHQYYEPAYAIYEIETIKSAMQKPGYEKEIISTEAGDLDLRLFIKYRKNPEETAPVISELLRNTELKAEIAKLMKDGFSSNDWKTLAVFLKSNAHTRPIVEKYQAENLLKRYCITLSRGVSQLHWLGIRDVEKEKAPDWFWPFMPMTDTKGRKKPHFYTYKLMREKLTGSRISELHQSPWIYKAAFENKPDLYILWNENDTILDLTDYGIEAQVLITQIITGQGRKKPQTEIASAKKISVGRTPVFVELLE